MKTIIIIPARLASSRLPNKPILGVAGKSMLQRIYENIKAKTNLPIVFASGDDEICKNVKSFGGRSIKTPANLPSGSDRIAYALKKLPENYDIVVNFQGDAINTDPDIINQLVELSKKTNADITTPVMVMAKEDYNNTDAVKCVADFGQNNEARALYFSRATVPHDRDGMQKNDELYHHIGIYAYKANSLQKFINAKEGGLEKREKLEQLRALEIGQTIWVKKISKLKIHEQNPADVDTKEELEQVANFLSRF